MTNIISTLGAGSGVDSRAVIDGLVAAERAARTGPLRARADGLAARISALGQVRAAVAGIASSLDARLRSGVLGLAPRSSDGAVVAERFGLGPTRDFAAAVRVDRLASAQRLVSAPLGGPEAPVGLGTLSISFGRRTEEAGGFTFAAGTRDPVTIMITPENNTLAGLAEAISSAGAGLTARVVNTGDGAVLSITGEAGADSAFVISAAPDAAAPGLERFNHTPGDVALPLSAAAGDAELTVDGVAVRRPRNVVEDVVPGVRLRLERTGSATVSAQRDPLALAGLMGDLTQTLSAFRDLVAGLRRGAAGGEAAGTLVNDATARAVDQALLALVNQPSAAAGGLALRDLGVGVSREGAFTLDEARLAALPEARRGDAERLLRDLATPGSILRPGRLTAIAQLIDPATRGLGRQRDVANAAVTQAEARVETYRQGLVRQFAAMDRLVSASKAVERQLDQQIAMWTRRDD